MLSQQFDFFDNRIHRNDNFCQWFNSSIGHKIAYEIVEYTQSKAKSTMDVMSHFYSKYRLKPENIDFLASHVVDHVSELVAYKYSLEKIESELSIEV